MEAKGESGAPASIPGLLHADEQIHLLFQKHLPPVPHIFFVPTNNPYRPTFPHENLNIPFEPCEIPKLQYMTLISNGDRGVGASKGASDWEEEVYGKSPLSAAGHSSTSTPNPARDPKKPSQKISFGDYKNFKQTGVKPSPRPNTATPDRRGNAPGHSRNTSSVSMITPMDRVPSLDGDLKPVVANTISAPVEKPPIREIERSFIPRPVPTDAIEREDSRPITNGHHSLPKSDAPRDAKLESHVAKKPEHKHTLQAPITHPLPPRPRSPPKSNGEQKKRPLELAETPPEKRVKIGHIEPRTPTTLSQKDAPRNSEPAVSSIKPSPIKSEKAVTPAVSPLPKKPTPHSKPIETNGQPPKPSKAEEPLDIPPLLSPLPADLESGPEPPPPTKKSYSEKATPPKTPSKREGLGSDTIIVKPPHVKTQLPASSPLSEPPTSSSPPFVLPRLLSPGLPAVVEEELLRLQQKSATLTVEARHEKARLPDAPGVARKTPRNAKVGHPPKRTPVEPKLPTVPEKEVRKSLIVRIPYKKRNANDIRRILAITQKPRGQLERLEAGERLARERSVSAAPRPKDSSDSEEDVPISKSRSSKTPAAPISKKRPGEDRNGPPPKRSKPEIDIAKASVPVAPAFKSPAISNPSASAQKSLLATPKKSETMKSAAMRRVDSNDGLARTPQTVSTSTPASAEKVRPNGIEARLNPEVEKQKTSLQAAETKLFALGTVLKRKMDSLVSTKNRDPSVVIPEAERKVGLCTGVESLMAYMLAFQTRDRIAHLRGTNPDISTWDSFVKLQAYLVHATRSFVELNILVEQMGAVARENLDRAYVTQVALIKDGGKVEKIAKEMKENSRQREATWLLVKKNEMVLKELGVKNHQILGPWSTAPDAVALASATLIVYSAREKLQWSPDPQLAAAREMGSGSK